MPWRRMGGVDGVPRFLLTSALAASSLGRFSPGTHWIEGPEAGLNDMERWKFLPLVGLELRPVGRPARSQSLYRLRYPGSKLSL
jgi:hypothetical protein